MRFERGLMWFRRDLIVCQGDVKKEIPKLVHSLQVNAVFANRDYEPDARTRDDVITEKLQGAGCSLLLYKDQVIFEKDEILNGQGRPYRIFTAYKKSWLNALQAADFDAAPTEDVVRKVASTPGTIPRRPSLAQIGFTAPACQIPVPAGHAGALAIWHDFNSGSNQSSVSGRRPGQRGGGNLVERADLA